MIYAIEIKMITNKLKERSDQSEGNYIRLYTSTYILS